MSERSEAKRRQQALLLNRSDMGTQVVDDISCALNTVLADVFCLYIKTKNFHWHMSGSHFRDYHLLLDDNANQLLAAADEMAKRVRKIGGKTIRSIGHISRLQRIADNDEDYVTPGDMLSELRENEVGLTVSMRAVHTLCEDAGDVATASALENWIDEAQRRSWFLFESTRPELS